jgi:hypothetical protein
MGIGWLMNKNKIKFRVYLLFLRDLNTIGSSIELSKRGGGFSGRLGESLWIVIIPSQEWKSIGVGL